MNCKNCNQVIPTERIRLGHKNYCLNCSTSEKYGVINIIYHKTGNTIQITDQETAKKVNSLGDRKRFGSSLKRGSTTSYNPKKFNTQGCSTTVVGNQQLYNEVGNKAMIEFENSGLEKCIKLINRSEKNFEINKQQASQLIKVFSTIGQSVKVETETINYNREQLNVIEKKTTDIDLILMRKI